MVLKIKYLFQTVILQKNMITNTKIIPVISDKNILM